MAEIKEQKERGGGKKRGVVLGLFQVECFGLGH